MRKDSLIYLLKADTSDNEIGDVVKTTSRRETFAKKNSIRQSEFYQAAATGLQPELSFTVWTMEYLGESQLEYQGKPYNIIRTFEINEKETELTCSGLAKGVG